MAQQRQGWDPLHHHHISNGRSHMGNRASKLNRHRRSPRSGRLLIAAVAVFLVLALCVTVLVYYHISEDDREMNVYHAKDDDLKNDLHSNVSHAESNRVLIFGRGSVAHGRDSRYWDKDDRRRDEDYNGDPIGNANLVTNDESNDNGHVPGKENNVLKKYSVAKSGHSSELKGVGLYNEAGRNELKLYEEKYEDSLKDIGSMPKEIRNGHQLSDDDNMGVQTDANDEYDDAIDTHDARREDYDSTRNEKGNKSDATKYSTKSHDSHKTKTRYQSDENVVDDSPTTSTERGLSLNFQLDDKSSQHVGVIDGQTTKMSRPENKRKRKRRKFSGIVMTNTSYSNTIGSCEVKFLNSTSQLVEPLEGRKFARFLLQYKEVEQKPTGEEAWEPRFGGHQTLQEREHSFLARDQKINCGFVKGPKGYPSTGFDLAEDDINYISRCHIAVASCIFGNSDHLRSPTSNKITRLSRKNVCFVMFVDEATLQTILSEGQITGFWKLVVVKNLPFSDMRRVGKIPKLLLHRLFPSARYSIWLDSKLRLKFDPLLILEYFLWRKGYEYAISNHYDRHCVWEEVAQNKRLNKYNHTVIDEQFAFYQADGLKRFNASDPNKLLPSNVPEGSFIVRAHTSMSNLFSCLWFNEVDRFTPRDQLSFAFTYQKLRRMNPDKPFHLNMFKDCERRVVAKLYRHRTREKRNSQAIE